MVGPDKENLIEECKNFALELNVEVKFTGKLVFDETKENGTQKKLLDSSKINSFGSLNSSSY